MNFFDINNILFEFLGVKMSYLECFATFTGLVAVVLSVRENAWSWLLGLVNVGLAFVLFYQIQLYPDMFLQIFFFVTNIIGFWQWKFPKSQEANQRNELKISRLSLRQFALYSAIGLGCTFLLGTFAKNLSTWIPQLFSQPSAFPYMDSFTTIISVFATFLLIRKKVEAWWLWLAVDGISTYMYFVKEVKLYSLLYAIFCVIALFGAVNWTREYRRTLLKTREV